MTGVTVLGALIAGGQARRFGADKALAMLAGRPLWRHVADALASQTDMVIACGRPLGALAWAPDWPAPDLGPLGGIAGALAYAAAHGFAGVVSAPCDTPHLPADLAARLIGADAAFAADCPVIGWWPVALAEPLAAHVARDPGRSLRGWTDAIRARSVDVGVIPNVNRPGDLVGL